MEGVERLERHWRWWVLLFWLATSAVLLWARWGSINAFALGDTDDNMRMMQVRALIAGQDWYDLRQHRLNPPFGADIHWSRLVDLPIAGIKLALAPLVGGAVAEKAAVAIAPLLPMVAAMAAVAAAARRLIAPWAFPIALAILLCGHSVRNQWAPLRIDHHGWQLALLAVAVASLTDPKRARGGVLLGLATALSLVIGLEMLLYLALLGGIAVLMWIRDPAQARRLVTYGAGLAGGSALGFLLFASYANRAPVCDALSPVWLSVAAAGGAIAVGMALLSPRSWPLRLALAAAAGAALAAGFALAWPHCLGRLEGASPELVQLWLGNVREARPLYMHGYQTAISVAALPAAGLLGYAVMLWRHRSDEPKLVPWAATAAPALLAALLLLWQSRAGPAAQLLAVPGASALVWLTLTTRYTAGPGGRHLRDLPARLGPASPAGPALLSAQAEAGHERGKQGQQSVPDPGGAEAGGSGAQGPGPDLRRSRAEADRAHPSRRRRRALSPQRPRHHRRDAGLPRDGGGGPLDGGAARDRLCADLPGLFRIRPSMRARPGTASTCSSSEAGSRPGFSRCRFRPSRPTGCGGSQP